MTLNEVVTGINIFPRTHTSVKASVEIELGGCFIVKATVIDGKKGMFISWPSRKGTDPNTGQDKYYSDIFPKSSEISKEINDMVMARYREAISQNSNAGNSNNRPQGQTQDIGW